MELLSPAVEGPDGWESCHENSETATDYELTTDTTQGDPLFNWPLLLPVMEETSVRPLPSFMRRLRGVANRWNHIDESDMAIKELIQLENPFSESVLRDIKRVLVQPPMTLADRQRLHHYQKSKQRALDKLSEREDYRAEFVFKVLVVDEKATDLESRFVVQYASDRIPYDQVMAITYAWHESDSKKKYRVTRQDGEPSITFTLGVEWDVDAVLETLAELSKDKWIWMDQFSLIQEKVTTEVLASDIPTIYRNARVVVFLPYRVCSILLSRINKFRDGQDHDVSAARDVPRFSLQMH